MDKEKLLLRLCVATAIGLIVMMLNSCNTQKTFITGHYNKSTVCPTYH